MGRGSALRTVPPRSPWAQLGVVLLALIGGPLAGLRLAMAVTPESDVVQIGSVFAFALTLVGGTLIWLGVGVVVVVGRGLWSLARGRRPGPESGGPDDVLVPPGYRAFPVLGVVLGSLTGALAGLLSSLTLSQAVGIWGGAGLAYGMALWYAAHHGYLPFPEPE